VADADANLALLQRVADGMLAASSRGRTVRSIGPFRTCIAQSSDAYLMSLALPVQTPDEWAPAIARLEAYFAACQRTVRLEFFEELFPTLAPALEAAGIVRQMTAPVMACTPDAFRPAPSSSVRIATAPASAAPAALAALDAHDAAAIDAFLNLQADAFGMPLATAHAWRSTLATGLADGMILGTVATIAGVVASGATLLVGGDVAELAGVGTGASFRRRGLGSAVCSQLMARYFAGGGTLCWLSAGPEALALYQALGFRTIGTQINIGRQRG